MLVQNNHDIETVLNRYYKELLAESYSIIEAKGVIQKKRLELKKSLKNGPFSYKLG